jgi:hypothetical protein
MKRKILVRVIAITFMMLALWYFGVFFWPMIVTPLHANSNLMDLIVGAFLFTAGRNLFIFKEFGRKLILVLLFIQVISFAFVTVLALLTMFFPQLVQVGWVFEINVFGQIYFHSNNQYIVAASVFGCMLIEILTARFLLLKETKELFIRDNLNIANPETTTETTPS